MSGLAPEGGAALVLARAGFVLPLLVVFGLVLFAVQVLPRAAARASGPDRAAAERGLARLAVAVLCASLFGWLGWVVAQSGDMAGAAGLADALRAVPAVLGETAFGRLMLVQLALLLLAGVALAVPWPAGRPRLAGLALPPATAVVLLQAGHGHAWAMMGGSGVLLAAGALHLACAGGWLGGLAGLLLLVCSAPVRLSAASARWFSPPGKLFVAGMVLSSVVQFLGLVGGLHGLLGTPYGWVALCKMALFGLLCGFAALNRYRLAPALLGAAPAAARRRLVLGIGLQSVAGLAVVLAASLLSSLPPAIHAMAGSGMRM